MRALLAIAAVAWILAGEAAAQELYVQGEAASNGPRGVWRLRASASFAGEDAASSLKLYYSATQDWQFSFAAHADTAGDPAFRGGGFAAKYRFLSRDSHQNHFRAAVFAQADAATGDTGADDFLMGVRRGGGAGLIGTWLSGRTAVSGTAGYYRAVRRDGREGLEGNVLPFSVSVGRLLLPREYRSYDQTNLNLYFELVGVHADGSTRLDLAPALQFIVRSRSKIDLSVRAPLAGDLPGGTERWVFQVAYEYYFF